MCWFPWMCMLCCRSCGQAHRDWRACRTLSNNRKKAGRLMLRNWFRQARLGNIGNIGNCAWSASNSRATGTLYRRTQGSSLTGLESSWANQRARCFYLKSENWHGKGSCCGKLTQCCQKASWQCFERRRWLSLAATSLLHHD